MAEATVDNNTRRRIFFALAAAIEMIGGEPGEQMRDQFRGAV